MLTLHPFALSVDAVPRRQVDVPLKNTPFLNLVLAVILVIAVGWLLVAGRQIILPIVTAVISVYVMMSASDRLGRLPVLDRAPKILLRALVLLAFSVAVLAFAVVVAGTVSDIRRGSCRFYRKNIRKTMVQAVAQAAPNLEEAGPWDEIRAVDPRTGSNMPTNSFFAEPPLGAGSRFRWEFTVFPSVVLLPAGFLIAGTAGAFPTKIMRRPLDDVNPPRRPCAWIHRSYQKRVPDQSGYLVPSRDVD